MAFLVFIGVEDALIGAGLIEESFSVGIDLKPGLGAHPEKAVISGFGGLGAGFLVRTQGAAVKHHHGMGLVHLRSGPQAGLQVNECRRKNRAKVRVRKWIAMEDFDRYEVFIADWHYFLKDLGESVSEKGMEWAKQVNTLILNEFIFRAYDAHRDFYPQFYERFEAARLEIGGQAGTDIQEP